VEELTQIRGSTFSWVAHTIHIHTFSNAWILNLKIKKKDQSQGIVLYITDSLIHEMEQFSEVNFTRMYNF